MHGIIYWLITQIRTKRSIRKFPQKITIPLPLLCIPAECWKLDQINFNPISTSVHHQYIHRYINTPPVLAGAWCLMILTSPLLSCLSLQPVWTDHFSQIVFFFLFFFFFYPRSLASLPELSVLPLNPLLLILISTVEHTRYDLILHLASQTRKNP